MIVILVFVCVVVIVQFVDGCLCVCGRWIYGYLCVCVVVDEWMSVCVCGSCVVLFIICLSIPM